MCGLANRYGRTLRQLADPQCGHYSVQQTLLFGFSFVLLMCFTPLKHAPSKLGASCNWTATDPSLQRAFTQRVLILGSRGRA